MVYLFQVKKQIFEILTKITIWLILFVQLNKNHEAQVYN